MKKALIISYCLFVLPSVINAQTPISLNQAIDTALANNLSVKNERLKSNYQQKRIKSGTNIPATDITAEYGQINSIYADMSFGFSQTINFPTVYKRQKGLLNEEWKSSVLNVGVQEALLKKQVTQVFYSLVFLHQKKELLQKNDSIFSEFLNKATLRFMKGESNILEKTTAENQRGQIVLQLKQIEQDMELVQLQFQLLLNTTTVFSPIEPGASQKNLSGNDTALVSSHPAMLYWKQQQQIASANTKLEQSKLAPDITVGYNIMGMKGTGADDKMYNSTPRFQWGQIGLAIPIFTGSQKARISAAKINENIAFTTYEMNVQTFENGYRFAFIQHQKFEEVVQYFENIALKNAKTITATANQQFLNGDINYLEWVLLVNQATSIQSDYIEAVKNRNIAVAALNYYKNK